MFLENKKRKRETETVLRIRSRTVGQIHPVHASYRISVVWKRGKAGVPVGEIEGVAHALQ